MAGLIGGAMLNATQVSLGRGIAAVVICAVCFSLLGGMAGYLIGAFAPGYYRGVFANGSDPSFDPVQVGIGQGVTQGLVGGVFVGLIIVALAAWHDARVGRR
ncbi:MAG: hypothetical protein ACO1SX_07710 [Actinomycetota bacterium]